MQLDVVIKSLSVANAAIKNTASPTEIDGWYPAFSASGQDVWLPDYRFDQRGIVVSAVGARCGKAFKADGRWNVCANTHALSVDESIADRDYCWYMLNNENWWIKGGTAQPFVKVKDSLQREHSFPPLSTQKRMVNQLDKINLIMELRRQELVALDDLIKARFVEMFGDPHRSKTYPYIKVSELTDVVSGGTPDRKNADYWNYGTIPWIKTTELQNNVIIEVEERITDKGLSESSAKIVPASTILIAMYGQGKTRGMTGFLGLEACTNQACACLLPTDKINMQYLWRFLILSYDELRGLAQGGNQPNLNAGMIKDFPILVPPMHEQQQFVSFVKQIDKSKSVIQKSLDETQLLFDSLMQKYFG